MSKHPNFHGPNLGYVLEQYEHFQQDANSVSAEMQAFFAEWAPPVSTNGTAPSPVPTAGLASALTEQDFHKIVGAVNLAEAIRNYGHLAAQLDPLGTPPIGDRLLSAEAHGVNEADLRRLPASLIKGPLSKQHNNAYDALVALKSIYVDTIGFDFDHLSNSAEREWLRHAAESRRFTTPNDPIDEKQLLDRLIEVETFEQFLHRIFPGKKRFSIEGLEVMVPMIDELVKRCDKAKINNVVMGMAHRGRLNVMVHNMGVPYKRILAEFKDPDRGGKYSELEYIGWTGDVKYHTGGKHTEDVDGDSRPVNLQLAANPSHLEHVNPVVGGMARAAATTAKKAGAPDLDTDYIIPLVIHGDAAFPGQGIVAETLNLSRLDGYTNGGTIHIIANNQIGFTTPSNDARSTRYASDLAKGFKIPIIHVNADDPVACMEAMRIAFAYRQKFGNDILIDLVGYRRYGHNEGDEPRFTQPAMYKLVDQHPTVTAVYGKKLAENGMPSETWTAERKQVYMDRLQGIYESLNAKDELKEIDLAPPAQGVARSTLTAIPIEKLKAYNKALTTLPNTFTANKKLLRAMKTRRKVLDEINEATIEWGTAESLAFASILADGTPIRITGEDVKRGTFSHRHAVYFDAETNEQFVPLQALPSAKASFEIHNSPLSENATIGFEYGYNIWSPDCLVIWEAQFGDFVNTAQAVLDEFVVSGRAKWEDQPSMVFLLPHGSEGQGPDHSTARPERFLQMAAEKNMRIVNPTTAAQYFHLLRRQAQLLNNGAVPLVVMSPKSLLRHPMARSKPVELTRGSWQPILDDPTETPEQITRLLMCSGKIAVELESSEYRAKHPEVAIARVEQLYPIADYAFSPVLTERYPNLEEVLWVQEEPANMGAWDFISSYIRKKLDKGVELHYVGRPHRASPAEGSTVWHESYQANIVKRAFEGKIFVV